MLEEIGGSFKEEELRRAPLIDLISRAGITIARVQQAITCTLADGITGGILDVDIGSPLLKLWRVFFDANDRAINYSEILYTHERFEYRMAWPRGNDNTLQVDSNDSRIIGHSA